MSIYEAINAVMADIGAIGKDKKNAQQNFNYRGIDDVMNALNPALIKHKVFVVPEVLEQTREERETKNGGHLIYSICRIKYTFYAEDGTNISAVVVGEGMDSGDKATNKAMAIAFKYACFQVFCIPTEEMKDPDSETPEPSQPKTQQAKKTELPPPSEELIDNETALSLYADMVNKGYDKETVDSVFRKSYGCSLDMLPANYVRFAQERVTHAPMNNAG